MAAGGRRGGEELPVYLARPGAAAAPRQKRGGLFCSVEGAFESKTLDFGALRVGQRRAPPPAASPGPDPDPGPGADPGPDPDEVRAASDKERLQNLCPDDDKFWLTRRLHTVLLHFLKGGKEGERRLCCHLPVRRAPACDVPCQRFLEIESKDPHPITKNGKAKH